MLKTILRNNSKDTLLLFFLIIVSYNFSYYLLLHYTEGDQVHYQALYRDLYGVDLYDIIKLSSKYVGSNEPVSAFILWVGANLDIEKNVYVSILNVILIVSLFLFIRKHNIKLLMACFFITNFYIIVLMTSAERLKISYMFLIMSMLSETRTRFFLLSLVPFSHFQNIILILIYILSDFFDKRVKKTKYIHILLILSITLLVIVTFRETIISKLYLYLIDSVNLFNFLNIFIFSVVIFYLAVRKRMVLFVALQLFVLIALIGQNRVNMIGVTVMLFILIKDKKIEHPLIYVIMAYFSLKSFYYIANIIKYGNGFYNNIF